MTGWSGYEISNKGRVRSVRSAEKILRYDYAGRPGYRYYSVRLHKSGNRKHFILHKLMWEVFMGPVPEGHQVDHIDRNRFNNTLDNLRCVTVVENQLNKNKTDYEPMSEEAFFAVFGHN